MIVIWVNGQIQEAEWSIQSAYSCRSLPEYEVSAALISKDAAGRRIYDVVVGSLLENAGFTTYKLVVRAGLL